MTQATTPTTNSGGSSMWDPFVKGEPIETLVEAGRFVLLDAKLRPPVDVTFDGKTEPRTPFDLIVATSKPGVVRVFSGFSAGIVGQVRRKGEGDLPALAKIVEQPTEKGNPTKALELVSKIEEGADAAAIAGSLPIPLHPIEGQVPY